MLTRKLIVVLLIGLICGVAGIWTIAHWLQEHGVIAMASTIRDEFLTGTAIAVIVALLILLPGSLRERKRSNDRWPFA